MKKLYMVGVVLLIIGGFNAGLCVLTGKDLIVSLFGRRSLLTNALFLGMGITALMLAFCRDFYLPFLGETVAPCSVMNEQVPEHADMKVNVRVNPGAKVMYWATESAAPASAGDIPTWKQAYGSFENAGVAIADAEGNAELAVRTPQAYSVPTKGTLNPHVHYRECGDDGMMKRVETAFLHTSSNDEGFVDIFESVEPSQPRIVPKNAIAEINAVAQQTATQSLMAESGAYDEYEHAHSAGSVFSKDF